MAAPGALANVSSRRAILSVHGVDQKTKIADGTCFQLVGVRVTVRRMYRVLRAGRPPGARSSCRLRLGIAPLGPEAAASRRRGSDSACAAHANRRCFQPCGPHRFLMTSVAELGSCLSAPSLTFWPRLREPPLAAAPGPGSLGRRTRWEP